MSAIGNRRAARLLAGRGGPDTRSLKLPLRSVSLDI
jgi:hypothetical protein